MTPRTAFRQDRRKPVLIVQHTEFEHAAAIQRALEAQGTEIRVLHPYSGEPFPPPSVVQGVLSLGGPMGANDLFAHPWIEEECYLLKTALNDRIPVVGICLGAQLLARSLGSRIEKNSRPEIGWFPLRLNLEGLQDPLLGPAAPQPLVYHWHFDTFQLPTEAILLGKSKACPRQAFRIGLNGYGLQFHPEVDHRLMTEWLKEPVVKKQIHEAMSLYGQTSVQPSLTQHQLSFEGARSSQKIVAGIAQLFRHSNYSPEQSESRLRILKTLKKSLKQKAPVLLTYEGGDRKTHSFEGTVVNEFTLPSGAFAVLESNANLLWPFRLDAILSASIR